MGSHSGPLELVSVTIVWSDVPAVAQFACVPCAEYATGFMDLSAPPNWLEGTRRLQTYSLPILFNRGKLESLAIRMLAAPDS